MIDCKSIIISKLLFERNMKTVETEQISVKIKRNYAVNKDEESKDVKILVNLIAGDKTSGKRSPFYCEMEIQSIFEQNDIPEGELEDRLFEIGMPIVMSFARVRLYELCQQASLNAVILPEFWD